MTHRGQLSLTTDALLQGLPTPTHGTYQAKPPDYSGATTLRLRDPSHHRLCCTPPHAAILWLVLAEDIPALIPFVPTMYANMMLKNLVQAREMVAGELPSSVVRLHPPPSDRRKQWGICHLVRAPPHEVDGPAFSGKRQLSSRRLNAPFLRSASRHRAKA